MRRAARPCPASATATSGVREAIERQVDALAFAHPRFFTNGPMERLADDLVSDAPAGLTRAFFTCG